METIDEEARRLARHPTNIDNFSKKYRTENNYFLFVAPDLWTIEKNLFYLLRESEERKFEKKYEFKPSYLSFDEYGTVTLEQLLMYVNSVTCIEEFSLNTVIIPSMDAITEITKDRIPKVDDISSLETVKW